MNKVFLFLKGLMMWACDVIPGVSGWTIAFITGIYDELIDSLHAFNLKTLKLLFQLKIKQVWKAINGNFLVILFWWIFVAILTLAKLISMLLENHPTKVRAFFFGLILVSVFLLKRSIKKFKTRYLVLLAIWVLVWFWITSLPQVTIWSGNMSVFFSWAIAIMAMILPGISGSYILLILGQYQNVLSKVVESTAGNTEAMLSLGIFMLWAVIGLLAFAKVLHYIKERRHDQMIIVLAGFMIGSLNKVRPRKQTIETYIDRHDEVQPLIEKNILPSSWEQALIALGLALVGGIVVRGISYTANKISDK